MPPSPCSPAQHKCIDSSKAGMPLGASPLRHGHDAVGCNSPRLHDVHVLLAGPLLESAGGRRAWEKAGKQQRAGPLTGPGCCSHELKGSTSGQEGGRKAAGSYTAPPVPACMLGGPPPGLLPHLNLPPTCTPLPPEHFFVFLWDLQQVEVLHGGLPGAGHGAGTQCACECLCRGQPFSPALLCRQSPAQGLQQASLCRPLLPVLFAGGQAPPPASRQFARPPVTGASPAPGARCCAAPARCVRTPAVQSRDSGCAQAQSEGGKKG